MEMPSIASTSRLSNSYGVGDIGTAAMAMNVTRRVQRPALYVGATDDKFHFEEAATMAPPPNPTCRYVQVFVVDIDKAVPMADRLLYMGEPKMTDATDQELFFELEIKRLLDAHNEKRTKIVDKTVKDRTQYLEPARIGQLKMNVVEIAAF